MFKAIATWRSRRQAIRELSSLTDRELADIGVIRGEIETIVRHAPLAERAAASSRSAQVQFGKAAFGAAQQALPSRA